MIDEIRAQLDEEARRRGFALELGRSEFGFRAALRRPERSASGDWFFLTADASSEERALAGLLRSLRATSR